MLLVGEEGLLQIRQLVPQLLGLPVLVRVRILLRRQADRSYLLPDSFWRSGCPAPAALSLFLLYAGAAQEGPISASKPVFLPQQFWEHPSEKGLGPPPVHPHVRGIRLRRLHLFDFSLHLFQLQLPALSSTVSIVHVSDRFTREGPIFQTLTFSTNPGSDECNRTPP